MQNEYFRFVWILIAPNAHIIVLAAHQIANAKRDINLITFIGIVVLGIWMIHEVVTVTYKFHSVRFSIFGMDQNVNQSVVQIIANYFSLTVRSQTVVELIQQIVHLVKMLPLKSHTVTARTILITHFQYAMKDVLRWVSLSHLFIHFISFVYFKNRLILFCFIPIIFIRSILWCKIQLVYETTLSSWLARRFLSSLHSIKLPKMSSRIPRRMAKLQYLRWRTSFGRTQKKIESCLKEYK